jgi:ribonuclease HI
MAAALPAELARLAGPALRLKQSGVAMANVLDTLAQPEADVSTVVHRYARVSNDELRQGFAALAKLLRALEKHAAPKPQEPDLSLPGTKEVFPTDAPTCPPDTPIDRVKMFIDGASRGNPGPAAIGVVFTDMAGRVLWQVSRRLEENSTNNVAEYEALREGLTRALGQGWKKVHAFSDSELLVKQMHGQYKIKNEVLRRKMPVIQQLVRRLEAFTISSIPREQNHLADRVAAHALTGLKKESAEC